MATLDELRRKVKDLRDNVERMKGLGIMPEAVPLGTIVSKQETWSGEVTAACIPNVGTFLGIFYNADCPSGWVQVTDYNDKFLMGGATYGTTGGAASHDHTYDAIDSHTHGTGFSFGSSSASHTHSHTVRQGTEVVEAGLTAFITGQSSNNTGPGGAHTHALGGSTSSTGSASQTSAGGGTVPPYVDIILCRPVP